MPDPALCSEAEVSQLIHAFYARVRQDEALGPIFNAHVHDWDEHMVTLVDFWSGVLRGTGRFRGAPMPKHVALPDLKPELFHRWLQLFHTTTAEQPNRAMAEQASETAQRIAAHLWRGYQFYRRPGHPPVPLFAGEAGV